MTPAPPKVLILCREWPMHWAALYVAAFRECCDVITAGPGLDTGVLASHGSEHTARWRVPNDLVTDADSLAALFPLLPADWTPDYIIAIQSSGPPFRDIAQAPCATAYVSVDSWHDPAEFSNALPYDAVFVAQKALVPYFQEAGCRRVSWLPLACSPAHHRPLAIAPQADFSFVGNTVYIVNRQRVARMLRLQERFSVRMHRGLGGDLYCAALTEGRAIFNSSVAQDVNMRVFEAMAIGRPLLTNRDATINGLDELFEEGRHYLGYDDDDLVAQAERLMSDAALREHLTHEARTTVLAHHTYRRRVDTLLGAMQQFHAAPRATGLSGLLPRDARAVLDVGLGLDRSRIALRRQGIQRVKGMLMPGQAEARAASYDALVPWLTPGQEDNPDAMVCGAMIEAGSQLDAVAGYARTALPNGGELGLRVQPDVAEGYGLGSDLERWRAWATAHGFHVIDWRTGPVIALRLRRFGRPALELAAEMYRRFPGGGAVLPKKIQPPTTP